MSAVMGSFFCVGFESTLLSPSTIVLTNGLSVGDGIPATPHGVAGNMLPLPLLPSSHWSVLYDGVFWVVYVI